MTINDEYDINREAAEISAKSLDKFHKYEYLTGEDILPSNQQQIIEQATFTYSPLGKALGKQIITIEDQGKKEVEALEKLKPKEETKPIEDKSNNLPEATAIFNELIDERKKKMKELHGSVDYNNLKFEYVDPKNNLSFYEYKDSNELFNEIKNSQIQLREVKNKQNEFLNK